MVVDHNLKGMQTALVVSLSVFFFILAIGIAVISGGVYNGVIRTSDANFASRTGLSYFVNQVRRCDRAGAITIGTFGDSDALFLTETGDGGSYTTCLYVYDGQINELYYETEFPMLPEDGVAILPAAGLELSLSNDGRSIVVQVQDSSGTQNSATVTPYCGVVEE